MALGSTSRSVGLEFDSGMIRAVEATGTPANPKLVSMAGIPLPEGSIEEGMVMKPQEVGEALRELWSSGAVKHRKVLLGVSNQGVLVRQALIPKVSKDKLKNIIDYQAQEYMPIPLDSVVLSYLVIGEKVSEGRDVYEVLLVAARLDMLDAFLETLEIARLEPYDIDVSTLSLARILPPTAVDRNVAVVYIANGLTNILIAGNRRPRLARLVPVKIKDLADSLGCQLDDVFKKAGAGTDDSRSAYSDWVNNLITEVRSSITYYQDQIESTKIDAIILNGRGALFKGLAPRLEEALGFSVRVVNPFSGFSNVGPKSPGAGIRAVEFATSAGLARRGLEGF